MSEIEITKKFNPLIVTPCTHDMVCLNYLLSVVRIKPMPDIAVTSSASIHVARNQMASHFLKGPKDVPKGWRPWSHLFFIDSDIGFSPDEFWRLVESDYDIATAAYPKRNESGEWVCRPEWIDEPDDKGWAECLLMATGFMCIKRSVLEKMREHYGASEIFDTGRNAEADEGYSEDIAFCMRWRNIGGSIHVDTTANLSHQGTKHYTGNLMEFIRAKRNSNGTGVPAEHARDASLQAVG